jgi:hypothetical protein
MALLFACPKEVDATELCVLYRYYACC